MAKYKFTDRDGAEHIIPGVLDPVALTGVETSSGSNLVTVASSSGLYPGMPFQCPNIPCGAFIHAVKSSTVVELWRSVWDLTAGTWSTSAANANATATGTGMLARALGFCPLTLVSLAYAQGAWRNLHDVGGHGADVPAVLVPDQWLTTYRTNGYGRGLAVLPTEGAVDANADWIPSAYRLQVSDHLAVTPLKRHNGELWGVHILVSTNGHQSKVEADPHSPVIYYGADT